MTKLDKLRCWLFHGQRHCQAAESPRFIWWKCLRCGRTWLKEKRR